MLDKDRFVALLLPFTEAEGWDCVPLADLAGGKLRWGGVTVNPEPSIEASELRRVSMINFIDA